MRKFKNLSTSRRKIKPQKITLDEKKVFIAENSTSNTLSFSKMEKTIKANNYSFTIKAENIEQYPIDVLCGLKLPEEMVQAPLEEPIQVIEALPSKWDWREQGGVTPVKNQGNCGSCWAFATVGPLESAIKIKDKKTVDLSEQFLVSCNTDGWGCNGGYWAHKYHVNPGAVLESEFSYQAYKVPCKQTTHPYKIKTWGYVNPTVDQIKSAIYTYGPVTAGVAVDSYFSGYSGGVFNHNYTGSVNHGIVLVGWDDSLGVWILKNSWGTGWGENGYMYIKYGYCRVGSSTCYVVYESTTPPEPPEPPEPPTPPSTENLALNKPVTEFNNPKYAVDGKTTTSWKAATCSNTWITVDLQAYKSVKTLRMKWSSVYYPKNYNIYYWTGSSWAVAKSVTSNGGLDEVTLDNAITGKIWSLNLSNPNNDYYELFDWEIYS